MKRDLVDLKIQKVNTPGLPAMQAAFDAVCSAFLTELPYPLNELVIMDKRIMYLEEGGTVNNYEPVVWIKPVLPLVKQVVLGSTAFTDLSV